MFKKYRLIVAMLIVGLVGTGFGQSVGATAKTDDTETQTHKYVYQGKVDKDQYKELEDFLANCLSKWNVKWDKNAYNKPVNNSTPTKDEVKQPIEEAEQPQDQPAEEVQPSQPSEEVDQETPQQEENGQLSQFEQQVVDLTNQERAKYGLKPLQVDNELSKVARDKSKDMQANNYFDHNSPTYGSPFDMMKSYGIDYRSAGENIAMGQRTPQEVVTAWMNSEGHRANILNDSYTHIGVGYVEQGNYWTQQFIGK